MRAYFGRNARGWRCSLLFFFSFLWNITVSRKKVITSRFPRDELKTLFLREKGRKGNGSSVLLSLFHRLHFCSFSFSCRFSFSTSITPLETDSGINRARCFPFSRSLPLHPRFSLVQPLRKASYTQRLRFRNWRSWCRWCRQQSKIKIQKSAGGKNRRKLDKSRPAPVFFAHLPTSPQPLSFRFYSTSP